MFPLPDFGRNNVIRQKIQLQKTQQKNFHHEHAQRQLGNLHNNVRSPGNSKTLQINKIFIKITIVLVTKFTYSIIRSHSYIIPVKVER